jgi:cysteine synthase A
MLFPGLIVVGVDTFGSVLFGQPDAPRTLRGLGNSLLPRNLVHSAFDDIHWVSAAEAYTATRELHRETALFRGGTSGAAWVVARYYAQCHPGSRVVCLFPDDGYRYTDSIYNDRYMDENSLWTILPQRPRTVEFPEDARSCWSCMNWHRRNYEEVVRAGGVRRKDGPSSLAKAAFSYTP